MADNISPEEKLFKIIQNSKGAPDSKGAPAAGGQALSHSANLKPKKMPKIGLGSIKHFFEGLQFKRPIAQPRAAIAIPMRIHDADLGSINKILALILALIMTFALYQLVVKRYDINAITEKAARLPIQRAKREAIEPFKPLSFYLEAVKKRDILQPAPKPEEIKFALGEGKPPEPKLPELASGLTLQGISWGEVPKAIVKSEEEEQIYFLKEGQMIGVTKVKIKLITKDKVIISHGEEEMELL